MSSNEVWAKCQNCGTELKQDDKQCPNCGSTSKVYELSISERIIIREGRETKFKRKGLNRPFAEEKSGWKPSGDPNLKKGVYEVRVIDRERDEYHHVVKDAATGQVIHEEHQRLSDHRK
ncbi:MAG: zinc ribbon domain-containing protein [Dehalococcoidales bacterium]|nr:zinc ribbon domain-containing protein [Dehalococcoidales bacterium]